MGLFPSGQDTIFRFPPWRANEREAGQEKLTDEKSRDELLVELQASQAREETLQQEKGDLARQQILLVQEFEHRLVNGLQLIASLLSMQSRTASPEACAQLKIAAHRVAAFGRVHRRLHLLDHLKNVDIKQYLQLLCDDLSGLLFQDEADGATIMVEGTEAEIPTALGIPLGLIVNELITNAAKHAKGRIVVRFEETAPADYSLSVLDEGPGLPAGFDPAHSKGLGMKITQSLVRQIDGALHILPGEGGRGTRFTVTFHSPAFGAAT
jgi:two-component system, sensor histidine kinase PdtaS